jgi:putative membrane protein
MRLLICVAAISLGAVALAADEKKPDAKPVTDAEFATKAASGDLFEIESSKLAKDLAKSDEVKKFAEQMIADHTKASKELMEAAKKAGVGLPAKATDEHAKLLEKVKGAKGEFDAVYMEAQMAAHKDAVELFTNAAKNAKDPGLKAFAEKTLPVIKAHYEHVQKHTKGK